MSALMDLFKNEQEQDWFLQNFGSGGGGNPSGYAPSAPKPPVQAPPQNASVYQQAQPQAPKQEGNWWDAVIGAFQAKRQENIKARTPDWQGAFNNLGNWASQFGFSSPGQTGFNLGTIAPSAVSNQQTYAQANGIGYTPSQAQQSYTANHYVHPNTGGGVGNMPQLPREEAPYNNQNGLNQARLTNQAAKQGYQWTWADYWRAQGQAGLKAGTPEWVKAQQASHYQVYNNPESANPYHRGYITLPDGRRIENTSMYNDQYDYPMYGDWAGVNNNNQQDEGGGWGYPSYTPRTYGGGTAKKTAAWVNLINWKI